MVKRIILIFTFAMQGCSPPGPTMLQEETSGAGKIHVSSEIERTVSNLSKLYLDGMVTLMLTEKMDKKEAFREIFLSRPDIMEIQIIRNINDFEFSNLEKNQYTEDQNQYLNSIVSFSKFNSKTQILNVELPFFATENTRGVNCIMCHSVQSGTVAGILRIKYLVNTAEINTINHFKETIYNFMCLNALPSDDCKALREIDKKRCAHEGESCL